MLIKEEFTVNVPEGIDAEVGLEYLTSQYYERVYQQAKYNQSKAAEALGITRSTLRKKLIQYFGDKYV